MGAMIAIGLTLTAAFAAETTRPPVLAWPAITREHRPWAYWWWMGSAVDETNIVKELTRYRDAGMGGVHIVPIYQARGWEDRAIQYLSPRWMEMLSFTVTEAEKLGFGVDMTTGSGWCFGGPLVTDEEANASVAWRTFQPAAGGALTETFNPQRTQTLMAFGPDGARVELTSRIGPDGRVDWKAPGEGWTVCVVTQKPSGQMVKRPAPGGEGHMLNLIYPQAMTSHLRRFDTAFSGYTGAKPRSQYHDSYEYRSDWSPEFFSEFEKRRGYRLQDELPALFASVQPPRSGGQPKVPHDLGPVDADRAARVKGDYRETVSDMMCEVTLPMWVEWSHKNGFLTRNEAHGSPGNWLDLYAAADIPESEMFHKDRNKLISKFASSAAHVMGKPLVANETGTWLKEHFNETLADMKYLLDDLFLSGINHVFYHGTMYSPDEAPWPGWLFYASTQMNPRNSIWHDAAALNAYAARCQAVLQSGKPDNDLLVYWPIHDLWHDPAGLGRNLTVHARDWFEGQPVGQLTLNLWERGYAFDYASDRQLQLAKVEGGRVVLPGGAYRAVMVPSTGHIALSTMERLIALAEAGAVILFEGQLPADVAGLARLEERRATLRQLNEKARARRDQVRVGKLDDILIGAGLEPLRERLFEGPGLMCIRRVMGDGRYYFIANRGTQTVEGWVPLATPARSVVIMDPMTGRTGVAQSRPTEGRPGSEVFLQLPPGASVILRTFDDRAVVGPQWTWWRQTSKGALLEGDWEVTFVSGGPTLPATFTTKQPGSWAVLGGEEAQRFAGTARYTLVFDAPPGLHAEGRTWQLELGKVAQSARVRLNGEDLGTLLVSPFTVAVSNVKPTGNRLEVEVTSLAANRIRDLDRRKVNWKNFHDINFVNIDYRPFDASNWPLADAGLLGPVKLTPVVALRP